MSCKYSTEYFDVESDCKNKCAGPCFYDIILHYCCQPNHSWKFLTLIVSCTIFAIVVIALIVYIALKYYKKIHDIKKYGYTDEMIKEDLQTSEQAYNEKIQKMKKNPKKGIISDYNECTM
ncbi:Hypothetical_protein [Hexamita inflata]|uniref:Hypothetical_protein n=1 Tax=Hexamita inflata TaxID=28002 RepID=A0AA86NLB2_9EUKA|nr:Hypothetical protein HINF_LOCUS8906 [Hexamita inflata]CAI9967470.1 Hypothetical protein HINF_LOCUS55115 [Hexamita inflata]